MSKRSISSFGTNKQFKADSTSDIQSDQASSSGSGSGMNNMVTPKVQDLIFRPVSEKTITLRFSYQSFEIIDTSLKVLPFQISYNSYFDTNVNDVMKNFLRNQSYGTTVGNARYSSPYHGIEIIPQDAELFDIIVLSDNIKTSSTGVTEVSSFVQNGKVIIITKPSSLKPTIFYDDTDSKFNYLQLNSTYIKAGQNHTTRDYLVPLTSDNQYKGFENIRFLTAGNRINKKNYNSGNVNNSTKLSEQIFPNYIGGNFYADNLEGETLGISTEPVSKTCGLFGKFGKAGSLLSEYQNLRIKEHSNYLIENMPTKFLNVGEKHIIKCLPPSGIIDLGAGLTEFALQSPHQHLSGAFIQNEKKGIAYFSGAIRGMDQAYKTEYSTASIIERQMNNPKNSNPLDLITVRPIKKTDGSVMNMRCSVAFSTEVIIKLHTKESTSYIHQNDGMDKETKYDGSVVENLEKIIPSLPPKKKVCFPFFVLGPTEKQCIF